MLGAYVCMSWLPGAENLRFSLLGLAQLVWGDALAHACPFVTFQTNYSLSLTVPGSTPVWRALESLIYLGRCPPLQSPVPGKPTAYMPWGCWD